MSEITPKANGNVVNYYSGNSNATHSKSSGYWKSISVINTSGSDSTLIINGMNILIKDGETFDDNFVNFNIFSITITGQYRVVCRE